MRTGRVQVRFAARALRSMGAWSEPGGRRRDAFKSGRFLQHAGDASWSLGVTCYGRSSLNKIRTAGSRRCPRTRPGSDSSRKEEREGVLYLPRVATGGCRRGGQDCHDGGVREAPNQGRFGRVGAQPAEASRAHGDRARSSADYGQPCEGPIEFSSVGPILWIVLPPLAGGAHGRSNVG